MNVPYLNQIKLGLIATIIVASALYVIDLRDTIASQKNSITELNGSIELQNQAAEAASRARDLLQSRLDDIALKNKKLSDENAKLKGDIINRPDAKTCEEAMNFVAGTAKKVAEEWNSK